MFSPPTKIWPFGFLMRWCAAFVLGVVLCVLPATQLLGYESAFVSTLLAVLTTPWTARLSWQRRMVLLCTPLLLLLLNALRVQNCNLPNGLLWYALLVVPQTTLAQAIYLRLPKRRRGMLFGLILLLSLGRDLYGVYHGPSIRVFDPLLGFYAGSLYDESLPIPTALYAVQALALCLAAALTVRLPVWIRAFTATAALTLLLLAGSLGFAVGKRELQDALSETIITTHLIIHHQPGSRAAAQRSLIWPEAERIAQRLTTVMEVRPQRPTHVYLYDDPVVKERLLGSRDTYFTRTWKPEIHITYTGPDLSVLDHELVHAFASEWSSNFLGIPLRYGVLPAMALIEGTAVALAEPYGPPPIAAMAAITKAGKAPDLHTLFSPLGFYAEGSERAYTAAGAFVRYWIDARGLPSLRRAYAGEPFVIADAVEAFSAHLATVEVSETLRRAYEDAMRGKALYQRVCGREQALRRDQAAQAMGRGEPEVARRCLNEILADDPHDTHAVLGLMELDLRGKDASLGARLDALLSTKLTLNEELRALELRLELAQQQEDHPTLQQVVTRGSVIAVRADERRKWFVRKRLLEMEALDVLQTLSPSTASTKAMSILWTHYRRKPEAPLVAYLLSRRIAGSDFSLARQVAQPILHTIDGPLRFETARMLTEWTYQSGDKRGIEPMVELLTTLPTNETEKAVADLWRARAGFYRNHPTF